jgi:glycosyltransferase involved in cell wall biosynthesis
MKRVVHVSDSASRLAGGMFESVRGLCRSLAAGDRWRPTMVAAQDPHADHDAAAWEGIPLDIVSGGKLDRLLGTGMLRSIEASTPEIVHLHGIWGPASRAAWRLTARHGGPRLVISPRGMLEPWALALSRWRKKVAWFAWTRALVERAAVMHVLCEEEAATLARLVPGIPICVVPNGIDLPELRVPREPTPSQRTLLFLGRIHPKKGLEPLIEAWARLPHAAASGWRLAIAGWDDGGYEAGLVARVRQLGIADSVSFLGPVFGNVKERAFRSASAFILPSFSEGLPMAVLEAWSHGLPVMMTDECHLGLGFVSGAALRVEPTIPSLTAALADLITALSPDELAAIGLRGRALVESRFTWPRIGAEMAQVYDSIVAGAKPMPIRSYWVAGPIVGGLSGQ